MRNTPRLKQNTGQVSAVGSCLRLKLVRRKEAKIYDAKNYTEKMAIGNPLMLSPDFPPPQTGHDSFPSSGFPSRNVCWIYTACNIKETV